MGPRTQHTVGEHSRTSRVVTARTDASFIERCRVLAVQHLGGDDDGRLGVDLDLHRDDAEVTVLERDHARTAHCHVLAAGRRPDELAAQDTVTHVERTLVRHDARRRKVQRLIVHVQLHDGDVRNVHDRLTGPREAEGLLRMDDRPRLMETVQERPRLHRRTRLLEEPTDADEAVRETEDRLGVAHPLLGEATLDDAPVIIRVQVVRRDAELTRDHQADPTGTYGAWQKPWLQ